MKNRKEKFIDILNQRVLLLDGAMGTMIQQFNPQESDFRGNRFAAHPSNLKGFNDILCLTSPETIADIHRQYLEAGADIISTNTFNANAISMADYGLDRHHGHAREINRMAAQTARTAAETYGSKVWGRAFVAGSIGPTNKTASMSPDVENPAARNIDFNTLFAAYSEQIEGLIEGGVDILLFETVFDTLNLKAGLDAANAVMRKMDIELPIMISATLSDKSGRTLSGQTIEAFVASVEGMDNVVCIGLNCGFGASEMLPHLRDLGKATAHYVSAHPNAGLPDAMGQYIETPESFALNVGRMLDENLLNIAGGCCGTTPAHISALRRRVDAASPRIPGRQREDLLQSLRLSGLDLIEIPPGSNFVNVGERCNVAGSRKFLRLIKEKNYEEAMKIARRQVESGAMMIDINMDDPLLNARREMVEFIRIIASDPEIARVPVMVDSSDWEVVEAALKNLQGKSIVNSISLKEGEESFIRKGNRIKDLGAAVIVMAFDEEGQADTYERKISICRRAYGLLTGQCGFSPEDILFDVNVMAVATGIETHNLYALDFIRAVEWVKKNLPGARTSGGISNLSFAFRGKNALRGAMHAVFLYHAILKGLDMGIVNPATILTYEDIPLDLRKLIEDVILARRPEAAEELAAYAASEAVVPGVRTSVATAAGNTAETEAAGPDLTIPTGQRLTTSIVKGNSDFLKENLEEALAKYGNPVKIIEGPLMAGMNQVGELFGEGKMFLPQVVKTARTMKIAVDILRPHMEQVKGKPGKKAGRVVFATVKGDVHDIGKNIVSIIMECNNFEVIDLGVMVPAEKIVATVIAEKPDFLFLSGLITPSLSEMVSVAKAMEDKGLRIPIVVGGASTSELHAALRIAPCYSGIVAHASDASQNPLLAARLLNGVQREDFERELRSRYDRLVAEYYAGTEALDSFASANSRKRDFCKGHTAIRPNLQIGEAIVQDFYIYELIPLINWKMFFHAWKLDGFDLKRCPYDGCPDYTSSRLASPKEADRSKVEEARKIYCDAIDLLQNLSASGEYDGKGVTAFYSAHSEGNDLIIENVKAQAVDSIDGKDIVLPALRRQKRGEEALCIADYVSSGRGTDYIGVFAVTAGQHIARMAKDYKAEGNEYMSLLCSTLSDRLAEASSELLHFRVRKELWGYNQTEGYDPMKLLRGEYPGIRPAIGYPILPDQLLNPTLGDLLPMADIGVEFTENGAMLPSSSVSGLYIANPEARYFMIGEIGDDQLQDYARRRGLSPTRIREIL